MTREHDIEKLPVWARNTIVQLREDLKILNEQYERLQKTHGLLVGREWFTIGDPFGTEKPVDYFSQGIGLWVLSDQSPFQVCRIYQGDIVVVGRDERRAPHGRKKDRDARYDAALAQVKAAIE